MSTNVYDILKFPYSSEIFVSDATMALSYDDKRKFRSQINILNNIAMRFPSCDDMVPKTKDIDKVFAMFQKAYVKKTPMVYSLREIRILTYSMHKVSECSQMNYLLKIIDTKWRDRFMNGLLLFLLNNWDSSGDEIKKLVTEFLTKKLSLYGGRRDKWLSLKQNIKYLSLNGPELLGINLKKQDKDQVSFCSLKTMSSIIFGMSNDRLDFEYFSRTIVAYFCYDFKINLDLLDEILQLHNYDATPKRLIPALVLARNTREISIDKDEIKALAIKMIGEPSMRSKWTLLHGSIEEKERLEEARVMLEKWIKTKFISLFFEECVHEPKRKTFWLKMVDRIDDFDIYCTRKTYNLLLRDNRLESIVSQKVMILRDNKDENMSALVLHIGNYYMVEFSDVGCVYLYLKKSINGKKIESKNIDYLYELKRPRMNTIQSFMMNFDEGKLPHQNGWENVFIKWMKEHYVL